MRLPGRVGLAGAVRRRHGAARGRPTVGPFGGSVCPFTINAKNTLAFANVDGLVGFEVGDLQTGLILDRVAVDGYDKAAAAPYECPSHGIAFTPDERELWVADGVRNRLHVFDAAIYPPAPLAAIELSAQPRAITFSVDGRYAYASTGEVLDTAIKKISGRLEDTGHATVSSDHLVEIDFLDGRSRFARATEDSCTSFSLTRGALLSTVCAMRNRLHTHGLSIPGVCGGRSPSRRTDAAKDALGRRRSDVRSNPRFFRCARADHDRQRHGHRQDPQGGVIPGATVVLISETKGTKSAPAITNETGTYVFPNVTADTYTVEVTLEAFKTVKRGGITVSGGDRVGMPPITLEPGALAETVTVVGQSPLVQTQSGERSFAVSSKQIETLPFARNNFTSVTAFAPGVVLTGASAGGTRIGGAGQNNIMMDGISAMDTGNNGQMLNDERRLDRRGEDPDAGLPGRVRPLERPADHRGHQGRLEQLPRFGVRHRDQLGLGCEQLGQSEERRREGEDRHQDEGYTIGGPVGKPGGNNKLFFFYSHEYRPVTAAINGGNPIRIRVPTAAERAGDFSQTRDNTGALFNLIKDPFSTAACTAASTAGCFQDGGVLGKIPANRLYGIGQAILNRYPMPNVNQLPGQNYNYEVAAPTTDNLTQQPAIRVDYQLSQKLRVTGKYSGQRARKLVTPGAIQGFSDVQNPYPFITNYGVTADYQLNNSTFIEGTYGFIRNQLAGGGSIGGILTGGMLVNDAANRSSSLPGFPLLYPNAGVVDPRYYAYRRIERSGPGVVGRQQDQSAAGVRLGHPHRADARRHRRHRRSSRTAESAVSRVPEHQPYAGRARSA